MATAGLSSDSVIAERYRVIRPIGLGGFGRVYSAEHIVTGRRCALKLLLPQVAGSGASRQRFLRESRLAAQIESEFIVDVLDAGVDEASDSPFIAMELLEGEDLGRRADLRGKIDPKSALLFLSHAAAALDAAHAAGIVHRDLKPSNLFLTRRRDGSALVKVLDFGTAKQLDRDAAQPTTGAVGTPIYMAPEQFRSAPVTAAVDIYALAMIAFRFLVGQHYFELERQESGNNYALGALLTRGVLEPASARAARYGEECSDLFDAWFARATALEPEARFRSAGEAIGELGTCLGIDTAGLRLELSAEDLRSAPTGVQDAPATQSLASERAESTPAGADSRANQRPAGRRRNSWAVVALVLTGAAIALVYSFAAPHRSTEPSASTLHSTEPASQMGTTPAPPTVTTSVPSPFDAGPPSPPPARPPATRRAAPATRAASSAVKAAPVSSRKPGDLWTRE